MTPLEYRKLGIRLSATRRLHGMTQGDLSSSTGLSVSAISSAERGSGSCTLDLVVACSRALHVSLDYLVFGVLPKGGQDDLLELHEEPGTPEDNAFLF